MSSELPRSQLIIAVHGSEMDPSARPDRLRQFHDFVKELGQPFSLQVTDFSCSPVTQSRSLKRGKCYTMHARGKALAAALDEGGIAELSLYSLSGPEAQSPAYDWSLMGTLGVDKGGAHCCLGLSDCITTHFSVAHIRTLLSDMLGLVDDYLTVVYGYAVAMPRKFLPSGYVIGVPGEAPEQLVFDATMWRRKGWRECGRRLRNVFPINLLTAEHLELTIGSASLRDWIRTSASRGSLLPVGEGLFLWSLASDAPLPDALMWDTPTVTDIRTELMSHRLFAWQEAL